MPRISKPNTAQRPARWREQSAIVVLLCAMTDMSLANPLQGKDGFFLPQGQTQAPAPAQGTDISAAPSAAKTKSSNKIAAASNATGTNKSSLNFVDADIESVIAAVGDYTNTTFIIDPRVKGTVTLVSEKPLTKTQAFQLLTSVLRLRGYSVVSANGYTKVVPEADAKLQAAPLQPGSGQSGTVRGEQIATQVFHLNFESANNLVAVLRPLISPNNTINANPGNNTLIITDYADNLLRLGKIIAAIDGPANSDLDVVPIRHAIASDIAAMVTRLMESGGTAGADPGRVSLLVYPRTNSIVVRAPTEARANLAKSLIEKLDQPTAQPSNVHVVYLKNAEATKLAQTLRAIMTSDSSAISAATPSSPTSPSPAQAALPTGGAAGFIQADPTTNTLIITASESVYRDLRAVIEQLDTRRAQVYIESLIVEVSAQKAAELGVQWGGVTGNANGTKVGLLTGFSTGGNNLINQAVAKATTGTPLPPSNGLTLGFFNPSGLGALAHALETDASSNILSMPNLITLDNEEAKIIVGQNVPFVTGQYTTAASSGGAAGVNPFQTVERKDIGLQLRVKPQISQGGSVRMAIYQENSSIDDSVNTNGAGLATTKRSLDTNVLVDDGQIIVLGGLIDDTMQEGVEKVPGLGDIPFIGGLFQYKKRSQVKRNLMVFLRPTIIRNTEQSMSLTGDRYEYMRNAKIAGKPEQPMLMPNMEPAQLPPLENGRMVGGSLFRQADPAAPTSTPPLPQTPAPQEPAAATPQQ